MCPIPRRPVIKAYQIISGRRFLDRLDELNRTQWLKREELLALQQQKLHSLLAYADQYVPYYHRLFDQYHFSPDEVLSDVTNLSRLPALTKEIIRENFDDLQTTESKRRRELTELTTSGSTGHPLVFMQDSNFRDHTTADWHRHLGWAGWKLGDLHCYIWGNHLEVNSAKEPRTRLMNWTLNRFVTNSFALSDKTMSAFADEIRRRKPRILRSYPHSLHAFARFVREHQIDDIKFESVISGAEKLYPEHRRFIKEVFGGPVFDRYGARELAGISCECEAHTGMHVSIENNHIEIVKDGRFTKPGEVGEVIGTNLNNYGMPFIRYRLGDLGAWSTSDACPCGRGLPMMDVTQGRLLDALRTNDGRMIWGAVPMGMYGLKGVKQFQVRQKSLDLVLVSIVKDGEIDVAKLKDIERAYKASLGENVEIRFEFVDNIPILESGQYRFSICEIDS